MTDARIGQHGSRQVAHDLMHLDQNASVLLLMKRDRFHVRVDLAPLFRPVGADGFVALDETAFECSGPSYVRSHGGEGGVNVSRVEGCVRRA